MTNNNFNNNLAPNIYQTYVNYQDIDAGDVVFHGHYVDFAARARGHMFRELFKNDNIEEYIWVIKDLSMDFVFPARLEELIIIKTDVLEVKNCSTIFAQNFFVNNKLIVKMVIKIVSMDKNYKFLKMNDTIKTKLEQFINTINKE